MSIELVLFCMATAGLSHFLFKCFEKGMIFHGYYQAITYYIEYKGRRSWYRHLYKPMGGCIYCYSFWVNTLLLAFYYGYGQLWYFPLCAGINYGFIEIIFAVKKQIS